MYLTAANFDEHFSELTEDSVQFKLTCLNIAQGIERKETTLISFVEAAGPYLTNKDSEKRLKGVSILATILDYLPRDVIVLDSKQMEYLCAFLVDRLRDHHTIIPAVLKALSSLLVFKNFPSDVILSILNGIFHNISCQTQQSKDRLVLYKIFDLVLDNNVEEISKMGPDFVYGVISAVENERNPQNLLYLFRWYPKFCKTVKLGHLTEEVFEILSCYFPVDFQPLNSNPDAISRDALADALSPGLYAIPEFGDLCINLALEKLSSDLLVAKFDSLKLLMNGTTKFSSDNYLSHSIDILSSIKREIFDSDNTELIKSSSDTLKAVSKKLSSCEFLKYEEILINTYAMVQENLEPSHKYYHASNLVLSAFARGSKIATQFILQEYIKKYKTEDLNYLKTLYLYTEIWIKFNGINEKVLKKLETLFYCASISDNKIIKKEGFYCLGLIMPYLTNTIKDKTIDILKTELANGNITENPCKPAILKCFECFAKAYSAEMHQIIQENTAVSEEYLEMLGSLVKLKEYTEIVMDIIINLCKKDLKSSIMAFKQLRLIQSSYRNDDEHQSHHQTINYLIQKRFVYIQILWISSILNEIISPKHNDFLSDVLYVIQNTCANDSIENQQVLVDELLPRIINQRERVSIVLISSLLARLKKQFDFNNEHLYYLVTLCFRINETEDVFLVNVSQELVCNLLNKCKSDSQLDDHLNFISQFGEISTENYNFISLITKGIVMRGHRQSSVWIQKMIYLLNNSDKMIQGFSIVLSDDIDSLSSLSFCTIRLFYKQRFFSEVCTILNKYPHSENYLGAFCTMLTNISSKIFETEFQMILPLILGSFKHCRNNTYVLSLLKMLQITLRQNKDVITGNTDEILDGLLTLFSFKATMEVRVLLVECVEEFLTGFHADTIKKYRNAILRALSHCIDDKKRMVRKVAAESRSKWFLFGENY